MMLCHFEAHDYHQIITHAMLMKLTPHVSKNALVISSDILAEVS